MKVRRTKVSVTGANGFIGSWTVSRLRRDGYRVKSLDRSKESLFRPDTLRSFVTDADVLVHLGGKNRAKDSELFESNTAGTVGLTEAVSRYNTKNPLIIYASSLQVYKPSKLRRLLTEFDEVDTKSAFASSKLLGESVVRGWAHNQKRRAVAVRISNVYGPGCRPFYNSVVATFLALARKGKHLTVEGDGRQTRDFIYVADVVEGIARLLDYKVQGFSVFNLCTGRGTSILELAMSIRRVFPAVSTSLRKALGAGPNHLVGDPTRLRRATGFTAKTALEEGIRESLAPSV